MSDVMYEAARQLSQVIGFSSGVLFWIYVMRVMFGKE